MWRPVSTNLHPRLNPRSGTPRFQAMNLIESRPHVMMGKPVVAGTRITVEGILDRLASGETIEGIVEQHPRLTREAVLAAIEFAAEVLRADVVSPVPAQVVPGHAA